MKFFSTIFVQTSRNLQKTWPTQFMTLITVTLSVLIFSFFFLIYTNMIKTSEKLGDDLRLTIYLDDEPVLEMQDQLVRKITNFSPVEAIKFISRDDAYKRLAEQLGDNVDVLDDLDPSFLPPSIEVYPKKDLSTLAQIKRFSEYLSTLPGAIKVQYGQEWVERFNYFTKLLQIIVLLSGILLIMTNTFMVAYTIRLAVVARQAELEILRLLGATNNYIRTPFLIEGFLQGVFGSSLGLLALFFLYRWIQLRFTGPGILQLVDFTFFSKTIIGIIVASSIFLCIAGSYTSMRKFMRI
ncbi:MAG: permease-like cell division protein FtsX [Desulfobulbales bacterium]|nr:permease-like cell division protein FtsX [Desulfobulbales bacterium]